MTPQQCWQVAQTTRSSYGSVRRVLNYIIWKQRPLCVHVASPARGRCSSTVQMSRWGWSVQYICMMLYRLKRLTLWQWRSQKWPLPVGDPLMIIYWQATRMEWLDNMIWEWVTSNGNGQFHTVVLILVTDVYPPDVIYIIYCQLFSLLLPYYLMLTVF